MFPKFKTAEEVPEAFKDAYHEVGGEWVAKAEAPAGGPTQEDVDALKLVAQKERDATAAAEKRAKDAAARVAELERKARAADAGVDMDSPEVKKWREEAYKEIRADVQREYAETPLDKLPETWAARKEAEGALTENRSLKLDTKVKALALKSGVQAERLEDWWELNGRAFELDEKGQPTVRDGKGKSVDQYIATDLKKARPYLYTGTKAEGGGAGGGGHTTPGRGGMSWEEFSKLSPQDKLRVGREAEADVT